MAAALVAAVFFVLGGWAMRHVAYDQRYSESTGNARQQANLLISNVTLSSAPTGDEWGPFPFELVATSGWVSSSSQLRFFEMDGGHTPATAGPYHAFMPLPEAKKGGLPSSATWTVTFPAGNSPLAGERVVAVSTTLLVSELTVNQGNPGAGLLTQQPINGSVRAYVFVTPESAQAAVAALDRILYPAIPIAVLLVAAVAYFATRRALRPVEAIRARTAAVTATDPRERVTVPKTGDEIARLATTINATLERLDAAAQSHRRFVADAAHELRSPLASLLANLEIAETYPDRADWPETVATAAGQARRIHALADDLLLLARLDAAPSAARPAEEPVDLAQLARDVTDDYADRCDAMMIVHCDAGDAMPVKGNPVHLERLLRNLMDNATRYASNRVEVSVHTDTDTLDAVLTVHDDGPGIPAADRERIFERFTRLDDDRSRKTGGTGLGLAIAREIVERYDGTLRIDDVASGASFTAQLPLAVGLRAR